MTSATTSLALWSESASSASEPMTRPTTTWTANSNEFAPTENQSAKRWPDNAGPCVWPWPLWSPVMRPTVNCRHRPSRVAQDPLEIGWDRHRGEHRDRVQGRCCPRGSVRRATRGRRRRGAAICPTASRARRVLRSPCPASPHGPARARAPTAGSGRAPALGGATPTRRRRRVAAERAASSAWRNSDRAGSATLIARPRAHTRRGSEHEPAQVRQGVCQLRVAQAVPLSAPLRLRDHESTPSQACQVVGHVGSRQTEVSSEVRGVCRPLQQSDEHAPSCVVGQRSADPRQSGEIDGRRTRWNQTGRFSDCGSIGRDLRRHRSHDSACAEFSQG